MRDYNKMHYSRPPNLRLIDAVRDSVLPQVGVERDDGEVLLEAGLGRDEPLRPGLGIQRHLVAWGQAEDPQSATSVVSQLVNLLVTEMRELGNWKIRKQEN